LLKQSTFLKNQTKVKGGTNKYLPRYMVSRGYIPCDAQAEQGKKLTIQT